MAEEGKPVEQPTAPVATAQDKGADAPAGRIDFKEFVDLKQDVRAVKKMLESFQAPRSEPRADAPAQDGMVSRAELDFRDALDAASDTWTMSSKQKNKVKTLWRAEQPKQDELEKWLSSTVEELGFTKAQARKTSTGLASGRVDRPVLPDHGWSADPEVIKAMDSGERKAYFERSAGQGPNSSGIMKRYAERMRKKP